MFEYKSKTINPVKEKEKEKEKEKDSNIETRLNALGLETMRYALISVLALYLSGPALAEQPPAMSNDLTIGIGTSSNALCPEAPPPPGWVSDLHPRQAWQGFHLLKIYQYLRDQEIVASGSCDCNTRFPTWAAAEAEYDARFASRSQAEQLSLLSELSDARNAAKRAARAICRAAGQE